ncbi:MAG: hypothetical protein Q9224_004135 [Gallowayella concinna]
MTSHASLLLCTWGESGVTALELPSQKVTACPAFKVEDHKAVDTVGAGDTFIAGMLFGLTCYADDWTLNRKLLFANELAGRKVVQEGFRGLGSLIQHSLGHWEIVSSKGRCTGDASNHHPGFGHAEFPSGSAGEEIGSAEVSVWNPKAPRPHGHMLLCTLFAYRRFVVGATIWSLRGGSLNLLYGLGGADRIGMLGTGGLVERHKSHGYVRALLSRSLAIVALSYHVSVAFPPSYANPGELTSSQAKMAASTDGIGQFADEGNFELDQAVLEGRRLDFHGKRGSALIQLKLSLSPVTTGESDKLMSEGQFEADKAIHDVSESFCPKAHAWGQFRNSDIPTYFLLADFREIDFHKKSESPTRKFGLHITTCHGKAAQMTDLWDDSWESLYKKQLAHTFEADKQKHPDRPEFEYRKQLVLEKCIPSLLKPLQSEGRNIKPCLVHGNIWDQNTATDMETGEPFISDRSAFYAHNEYELGNWRDPRHRLGSKTYIRNYKRSFPASEPEEDWDSRNLLYSLRFKTCAATLIPGSNYREQICPDDLAAFKSDIDEVDPDSAREDMEEEEEEEEEEEGEEEEVKEEEEGDKKEEEEVNSD